jgi:diguanylate cyclase (GGDEF)-like protein/putative nucleotidyltransferase with HDIG domain
MQAGLAPSSIGARNVLIPAVTAEKEEKAQVAPSPAKVGSGFRPFRGVQSESRRRAEIRARAIDATLDADRRRVGERVAVVFRWLFLVVLGVLNNVLPATTPESRVTVDIVLGGWAVMNVVINVLLARGYQPGKQFSLTTMTLDIFFASGLVYLSNGFSSPFFLALFLAVITNAVRFGATASVVSALVIAFIYLFVGGSFTPSNFAVDPNATIGKVFLFVVVALSTGYMTRELERERRQVVGRAAEADTLRELSTNMVTGTDIKDVFKVLVDNAVQMTNSERGHLVLTSQEGFEEIAAANREGSPAPAQEGESADVELLTKVSQSGEAAFALDRKGIAIPIASGEGVTALLYLSKPEAEFSNQDLFTINALAGSSAVPLANALRFNRSSQEASTDSLTGLANVREFRRRLDIAFARPDRHTVPMSLLLVDFDHFKSVNDQLGHQHGDLVLQLGARIVRATARSLDLVARYGGDELVVMATDSTGAGAQRLAYRIVDAVHAAAVATTLGKQLTFSIGVATYPEDALTAQELVAAADQALYMAKREGKDRACTFPQLVTELELETEDLGALLAEAGPQVVVAAAHAVDHRNPIAQGHSSRVAAIADAIGRRTGIPSNQVEDLRTAAFLHDVGHLTMASGGDQIEVPGHAEEGERIVRGARFPEMVAAAVRHHHERWDGTGTPDALVMEQIPMASRVLAVVEAYEALTAGRGCDRLTPADALARVTERAGFEFDPAVVEGLKRCIQDGVMEQSLPSVALPAVAS